MDNSGLIILLVMLIITVCAAIVIFMIRQKIVKNQTMNFSLSNTITDSLPDATSILVNQ